jgi:ethanolamine utilization protein EutA
MTEGEKTAPCVLERVASRMAGLLLEELGFAPASGLLEQIRTAHSSLLPSGLNLDAVCFSGGVAESVYSPPADGAELFPYGDIGVLLGKAISESDLPSHTLVIRGLEAIRATVVGAGSYATTLSGSTISFSHDIFPLKNIPVVWMDCLPGAKPGEVAERLRWFRRQIGRDDVAISFKGENNPSFSRLESLADTLAQACTIALPPELPLIAVVEADIGKALGQSLQRRLGDSRSVISIDGVSVRQGDYIDLGKPLAGGLAIPVVIKTLIFNDK